MIRWLLVLALAACGACGASATSRALSVALVTTESAQRTLLAYDRAHERELASAAKDKSESNAALLGWHQLRDKVQAALMASYEAIAVAETAQTDDYVGAAVRAASELATLLRSMGVTP